MTGHESLRTDDRSFLIYDEEVLGAVARGLESYAQSVTGQKMSRHPDPRIRGIGNMMLRIGEQRGHDMVMGDNEAQKTTMNWLLLMGAYLAGVPHDEIKREQALEELWGTVIYLDSRVMKAGIAGPGIHRIAVRGD